ncbi:tetratricopeptide repeat protein [Pseudoxanthomonas putridarboris]|uniref:Tetratricopeptide repeat protein n=1 Tax=Pseudoxanthomonas putridarboris TaxID=752605 RepID=A0ABU9IZ22_9GAMM
MKPAIDGHAPGNGAENGRYCFDDVVVDEAAHTLLRDGRPQPLEPKAFAVLLALLRRPGELLGRDELLDDVWGHRHVTPGVLTRAIAQLRSALDDDSQRPRYIQTQHALGYRFIGVLRTTREDAAAPALAPDAGADPATAEASGAKVEPAVPFHPRDDDARMPPGARLPHRWAWAGSALLLVVALAVWGWGPWRDPRAGMATEASIAVLPFISLSDDPDDRYFAEGLAVEMHDALAGVPGLKVAAHGAGARQGDKPEDMRAQGARLGVAAVLDASVRRDGPRVRINARLADTRSGFTLWSDTYDREAADVFALQSDIAREVVEALLGHLPGQPQALETRFATTADMGAYDSYLRGLAELQRPSGEDSLDRAIRHFRAALQADKGFARAQAGICRAEINRLESAREAVAFARAQAACRLASQMDPTLREVNLAMAEIARVSGEHERALRLYEQAMEDPSLRADASIGMARTHAALGKNETALRLFQQAAALRPGDALIYSQLGYHHYLRGDLDKAIQAYSTATTLQPRDSRLWSSLGGLYLAKGDATQAGRAFSLSLSIEPNYAALSNLGTIKFEQGDYENAADMYRRAAALQPDDYLTWGNLGDALAMLPGNEAMAHEAYARAARQAEGFVAVKSDDAYALAVLSWYHANLGQAQAAREWLARAEAAGTQAGEVALWGAQSLARLGDRAAAQQRIARARREGIPEQRIATAPALQPLVATR